MVEWKKLGDVCSLQNGFAFKSGLFKDIGLPIIRITNISDRSVNLDDCKYFKLEDYKGVKLDDFIIRKGDILVAMSGATTGKIGIYNHNNISYLNQRVGKFIPHEEILENRYLYHFLLSQYQVIYIMAGGGAQPNLSSNKLLNDLLIPIPSKSEQERIVSILDTFTSSIANLKEQIKERRKQYEHYRDQLLDLEGKEGVEMKTIKQIFDTRNGYTPSTKNEEFWNGGTIPWFKMEDIRDNGRILYDSNLHITTKAVKGKGVFNANSIILATSATIGEHALILTEHLSNQRFTNFYPKKEYEKLVNMKFYYYYMYIIDEWCKQHTHQGGFASVDMEGLYKLEIPLPSLQTQSRIVTILDQFEASIANLEAQLKEREKQYEYYRNQLLTFE